MEENDADSVGGDEHPLREGSLPYLIREYCGAVDWDAVISRAESHPEETRLDPDSGASVVDETILHRILWTHRPPTEAVAAIINGFPKAIDWHCCDYISPLTIACGACHELKEMRPQSPQVIRLLLRSQVDYLKRNRKDENPLSNLHWNYIDAATARVLLEEFPEGAIMPDRYGRNTKNCDPSPFDEMIIDGWGVELPDDIPDWAQVRLLLTAADHGAIDRILAQGRTLHPVHAVLRRIFHPDLVAIAENYDANARSTRSLNALPLLKVIKANSPTSFYERDDDGDFPVHLMMENERNEHLSAAVKTDLIQFLMAEHPQAASTLSGDGRLPLHLAVQNGWPWQLIFSAEPRAVSTRDVSTGLYPFQLAACRANGARLAKEPSLVLPSLETTYLLLLEDPSVLSRYILGADV